MSHSTTATSTYLLTKYSRAYPSSPQQPGEWQHFTNPVLRLALDTTKRGNGELDSVRLRVLWNMNSSANDTIANPDMVFEDLELLSFSSLLPKIPQKQSAQSLPLKAIYRDTTVGMRYLYPYDNLDNPCYRRFQISFQTADSASGFIRSIRAVCPCKATPNNMGGPTAPAQSESILPSRLQGPSHAPQPSLGFQNRKSPLPLAPPALPTENRLTQTSKLLAMPRGTDPPTPLPTFVHGNVHSLSLTASSPLRSECTSIHEATALSPVNTSSNPFTSQLSSSGKPAPSRLESSGTPSSIPLHVDSETQTVEENIGDAFLKSLGQATQLHTIPPSMLERLVSEVIREDGFITLLENLDRLWRMKSPAGTNLRDGY